MKQMVMGLGVALLLGGCAFNPESMPLASKDMLVYVDKDAPKTLLTKEKKAKVAVVTSVGEYGQYKAVAEALDSSLNARLSNFSFFQVVDRKSQAALAKDAIASGEDVAAAIVPGVEADFVVIARLVSLTIQPIGQMYSLRAVFDFKWISKATQRVIMTESLTPSIRSVSSAAEVIDAFSHAAKRATRDFCVKIGVKYAPPARVLETRGNGAAARISLGKNYGIGEGTQVCFYEIVDNSDVGGEKRDKKDIALGQVKRVEENTAWVAVENAEQTNVRKGVYVRMLGQKKGFGASLLEGTGLDGKFGD